MAIPRVGRVATEAKFAGIALDVGDEGQPVDRETVTAYLDALERLMIVENGTVVGRPPIADQAPGPDGLIVLPIGALSVPCGELLSTPRIPGSPPQTSAPAQ